MKEYLKYNQNNYLHKDRKKYAYFSFLPFILISVVFLFIVRKEAYSVYETNGQILCEESCSITFYYPYQEGFSYDFIKINGQKIEIEELFFGNVILDSSNIGMQSITLKAKEYKGNHNEFVKLQIYKNKEKMLKKIGKIIKER